MRRKPEVVAIWLAALRKNNNNYAVAARELGIPRQTLVSACKDAPPPPETVTLPEFPDDDIPVEDIIETMAKRFRKRKASFAAHTWFPVKVAENKPIGLMLFGDPHLDDNGCDWDTLRQHVEICRDTPGIFAVNIGDSTNSWGGRLIRKYADQDASLSTARKLVEWFLLDSGVHWIVWLYGNHEHMGDGSAILAQMAKRFRTAKIAMHDWEARFTLQFPGGRSFKVYAAHNLKGTSIWNPMHGPMREGQVGVEADIYVAGHLHYWGIFQYENAARGLEQTFVRVRGYKHHDDYARKLGIIEQDDGASILLVLDPRNGAVLPFKDVAEGARYLTFLRGSP